MSVELIEPFPPWAWPLAWAWFDAARRWVSDDFSPRTAQEFVELYSSRYARARSFGVLKERQLGGVILFEESTPVVFTAHVLFARRMRGPGTAEALWLACKRVFETGPAIKILGLIPEDNRLAIALAVRNGDPVAYLGTGLWFRK